MYLTLCLEWISELEKKSGNFYEENWYALQISGSNFYCCFSFAKYSKYMLILKHYLSIMRLWKSRTWFFWQFLQDYCMFASLNCLSQPRFYSYFFPFHSFTFGYFLPLRDLSSTLFFFLSSQLFFSCSKHGRINYDEFGSRYHRHNIPAEMVFG